VLEEILIIRPPSAKFRAASCNANKAPLTLIAKTRSKFSSVTSAIGSACPEIPALLTKISMCPNCSRVSLNNWRISETLLTSACIATARPPKDVI
jgi:hypothetical protein